MKKVREEKTDISTNLKQHLSQVDFADTFATTNCIDSIEDITKAIFGRSPKWIDVLFAIRNKAVRLFGLKTSVPADYKAAFCVGAYIGFFKIYAISDHEVVVGKDDDHLDFRAIIKKEDISQYNVKVITLVKYNNVKGRVYMTLIAPFHKLVVKRMVRNACKGI